MDYLEVEAPVAQPGTSRQPDQRRITGSGGWRCGRGVGAPPTKNEAALRQPTRCLSGYFLAGHRQTPHLAGLPEAAHTAAADKSPARLAHQEKPGHRGRLIPSTEMPPFGRQAEGPDSALPEAAPA